MCFHFTYFRYCPSRNKGLKFHFALFRYRTEERAGGWYRLTREILKVPDAPSAKDVNIETKDGVPPKPTKDKAKKTRRPQLLIKLVMRRFTLLLTVSFFLIKQMWICVAIVFL